MNNFNLLPKEFIKKIAKNQETNAFFHAVIINSPSYEVNYQAALYWACQIVCVGKTWCQATCENCYRIINNNYYDFQILNTDQETVKKEKIINLINNFSFSALETSNKKIYLIKNLETASVEANNTLLKFLEEPPVNTYAIITTKNLQRVLTTITSRCQVLSLSKPDLEQLTMIISEKWQTSPEDAVLISNCFFTYDELKEQLDYAQFLLIKQLLITFLRNFLNNNVNDNHLLINELIKLEKKMLQIFWKLLIFAVKDTFLKIPQYFIEHSDLILELKQTVNKKQNLFLAITYECLEKLTLFVNKNLLVDYFLIQILKI